MDEQNWTAPQLTVCRAEALEVVLSYLTLFKQLPPATARKEDPAMEGAHGRAQKDQFIESSSPTKPGGQAHLLPFAPHKGVSRDRRLEVDRHGCCSAHTTRGDKFGRPFDGVSPSLPTLPPSVAVKFSDDGRGNGASRKEGNL